MDEALNALLLKTGDPLEVFRDNFKFEELNDVDWDGKDFDPDLFDSVQLEALSEKPWEYKCWASMRIKGRLLIEAYIEQILPKIKKVISVQKNIEGGPGILDAVLELDYHGVVLIDHKTSARPYYRDAVQLSTQLALYASREKITKAGFVVLVKQIKKDRVKKCQKCGYDGSGFSHKTCNNMVKGKRCHGVWAETVGITPVIQLIVDDIPQANMDLMEASLLETEEAIAKEVFPPNLNACAKMYGKPCAFYNKCWKSDDTGLVFVPERKKK